MFPCPEFFENLPLKKQVIGAGAMAQVVECLPNKGETLSSNPSTTKKKKKKEKQTVPKKQGKSQCT
jgi:hypothetical protein